MTGQGNDLRARMPASFFWAARRKRFDVLEKQRAARPAGEAARLFRFAGETDAADASPNSSRSRLSAECTRQSRTRKGRIARRPARCTTRAACWLPAPASP